MSYSQDLTLSWCRSLSYRNQSHDLQRKSRNWFLYHRNLLLVPLLLVPSNLILRHCTKNEVKDFFRKYAENWSHLLKKTLMENFILCAVRFIFSALASWKSNICLIKKVFLIFAILKWVLNFLIIQFVVLLSNSEFMDSQYKTRVI